MIHKIEQLTSIGKFRDYTATGDVAFKKLTLFYADNGIGKTTLTSIIRSLTSNDLAIIPRRLSTGATLPQVARIIQQVGGVNTTHTFRMAGWSNPFPEIEVFDTHFVSENIYSGFHFTDDHKKQLYQFVIGAQGVAVQQQIEHNKQLKAATRQNIERLERQILQQTGNGLTPETLNAFLALRVPNPAIVQAINTAELELANANASNVIQTLPQLNLVDSIRSHIDFNAIIADLQQTSQTIQDAILESCGQ